MLVFIFTLIALFQNISYSCTTMKYDYNILESEENFLQNSIEHTVTLTIYAFFSPMQHSVSLNSMQFGLEI